MEAVLSDLPDLAGEVYRAAERRIKVHPQHTNRASDCGHSCERYLVLSRTRWAERVPHDVGTEFVFQGGRLIEDMVVRELQDAGFRIIEQQRAFEWPAYELTGHLDFKVLHNGRAIPVEVKGLNHNDWMRLNVLADFLDSTKPWIRKYPGQLSMYCLHSESEVGAFYLKDKLTFQPKVIWFDLDYDYAETICQKLARVNAHIKAGTLPNPINDYLWCERCPFLQVCLPEIKAGADLVFLDDENLLVKLQRRETLSESATEYRELDEEIKKVLQGREKVVVGDYLITGKQIARKGYAVPESAYWQCRIAKLGGS